MKKEYEKAEVKVYELEVEYTLCNSIPVSETEADGDWAPGRDA